MSCHILWLSVKRWVSNPVQMAHGVSDTPEIEKMKGSLGSETGR